MGCDAFADENGEFEILVENYDGKRVKKKMKIDGLEPKQGLMVEYLKGRAR